MKKAVPVVGLAAIVAAVLLATGGVPGIDGEGSENVTLTPVITGEQNKDDSSAQGEGGGNQYNDDNDGSDADETKEIVAILIEEDVYTYGDELYDFEGIIALIQSIEGEFIVELRDEDATYKAYSTLVDKLAELEIAYVEK